MVRHTLGVELLISQTYEEWLRVCGAHETQNIFDFGDGSFVCFDSLDQSTTAGFLDVEELEAQQDLD